MKKSLSMGLLMFMAVAIPLSSQAQTHFQLGGEWETGEGFWVVVSDVFSGPGATDPSTANNILVSAALDGLDPKHAWVNRDFGPDYTVRCDVIMESWVDDADLSRAGVAVRTQPRGQSGSNTEDRAINLLYHQNISTVEYLNDKVAWANTNDNQYPWVVGTWYTFELTVTGQTVNGKVWNRADGPTSANAITLAPWTFSGRATGFPGVTASTNVGLMASFDNFTVEVNGQQVFFDDFEAHTTPQPQAVGLSDNWVAGEAGFYIVQGGELFGIATNNIDPKHAWYREPLVGGASISADVRMVSWQDEADLSRAGLALHIQNGGTAGGRQPTSFSPGEDRAINMLFHQNINTIEFLNDLVAWANLDDNSIPWDVGSWYRFDYRSDGFVVDGTFNERGADASQAVEMQPWQFPGPENRLDGFAGLTASTRRGLINAWDNVEIRNEAGQVVFSDDFETFVGVDEWSLY